MEKKLENNMENAGLKAYLGLCVFYLVVSREWDNGSL